MVKDDILYFLHLVAMLTKLYYDFYLSANDLSMLVTAIISLTSNIHWYATQSIHYIRFLGNWQGFFLSLDTFFMTPNIYKDSQKIEIEIMTFMVPDILTVYV